MNEPIELIYEEGTVDEVVYCNEDNGYIVLMLDTGTDLITVTGELGLIEEGEELRVSGEYVEHPKFGTQFHAVTCERKLPATETAILKYLASGAIKGIGATTAKKIVDRFGTDSLDVIENSPDKLATIKGISASKAEDISQEFRRIHGVRSLMIFLSDYAVTPSAAMRAWKRWGTYSKEMIKTNPYILCEDGIDIEFGTADKLAGNIGIASDDPNRVTAGVKHVLKHNSYNGHTCLPEDRLRETAAKLLRVDVFHVDAAIESGIGEDELAVYVKDGRRFIALSAFDRAERYIADRLLLMNSSFIKSPEDMTAQIEAEERSKGITYAEKQREAISEAITRGFLILTGGPGTGKTTTLKAMISLFEKHGMNVLITAPTGRAAKRISDLSGYPAQTIHRLLEVIYEGDTMKFRHNERDPLKADVVIIDEMSMVDTLLFDALLRGMKLSCRLIMVGDSDQLPSVGAGNILGDMIDSGKLRYIRLTEIFRQAQQSLIVTNAHAIVNGSYPVLNDTGNDFFFMQRLNINGAVQTTAELAAKRLPDAYGFSPLDDIQVLCPTRKGLLGTVELNKVLQNRINPPNSSLSQVKGRIFIFRENDKVMQCRNNYDIEWVRGKEKGTGIFNGDIGTIVKVLRNENCLMIDFEGRITKYPMQNMEDIELAYAVTVHKSQGSEFNAVIIPLLGGFEKLYYRNLLYTAVTRAKKLLIIVGSREIVDRMVDNNRRTLRYTTLKDRLTE